MRHYVKCGIMENFQNHGLAFTYVMEKFTILKSINIIKNIMIHFQSFTMMIQVNLLIISTL